MYLSCLSFKQLTEMLHSPSPQQYQSAICHSFPQFQLSVYLYFPSPSLSSKMPFDQKVLLQLLSTSYSVRFFRLFLLLPTTFSVASVIESLNSYHTLSMQSQPAHFLCLNLSTWNLFLVLLSASLFTLSFCLVTPVSFLGFLGSRLTLVHLIHNIAKWQILQRLKIKAKNYESCGECSTSGVCSVSC